MIRDFHGNETVVRTLTGMAESGRIPQTILVAGPEGTGKATLGRRFASLLLGDDPRIEADDLSLPANQDILADREKWTSEKRAEDPLFFASHPDFVTFPTDGPLRQISIQQIRLLRERIQYKPLKGRHRVFLIDGIDSANEQAANSLLKTLEEPPDHAILFLTAQNPYDLLPTIRSRAVMLHLSRLTPEEMTAFARAKGLTASDRRLALAGGCPGLALTIDLDTYDKRRSAMLKMLQAASGSGQFADWAATAEKIAAARSEKLETSLEVLYLLLQDVVNLQHGIGELRNPDIRAELNAIASRVDFEWVRSAVGRVDEIARNLRRNIQKNIALDAFVAGLRPV